MIRKIQIAGLVGAIVLAVVGITQAHEHRDRDESGQYAYHRGYRDGFAHGQIDRSRGAGYSYQSDEYEDADGGYSPQFGSHEGYRENYREGYVAGYDDSFYGRARRFDSDDGGRYSPDGSFASQIGYEDGLIDGRKDLRANKPFRPDKHDRYEDANHGYRSDYGNKKLYKQQYRQAYTNGYQDGYHGEQRGAYNRP